MVLHHHSNTLHEVYFFAFANFFFASAVRRRLACVQGKR